MSRDQHNEGNERNRRPARPWWLDSAKMVARRPDLWATAFSEAKAFAPMQWWRRWPPLPLPDKRWVEFRMETAYGDCKARPEAEDTVKWLEWCRSSHSDRLKKS